jgi:hypothetical protein
VHGLRPSRGAGRGPPGPAPGGALRIYEHVRADDPRLARWQDRLERPWGWLALGCHPNRDVVAAITAAGFRVLELDRFDFQIMPPLVRPHVLGVAERPTHPPPRSRPRRGAKHLSALRDAGLLTSHRVRHQVIYERTPLGMALAGAAASARKPGPRKRAERGQGRVVAYSSMSRRVPPISW